MKSRKFTYLLLTCVIALWGMIFYRVYGAINEEELSIDEASPKKVVYFKMINHSNDHIKLDLSYRDPFLSGEAVAVAEAVAVKTKLPAVISPVQLVTKPVVNWAGIVYTGYINNINSKQKLIIMMVNGKECMLEEGQNSNGIKLLKYAVDSVKIQYQNEAKYIKLK